MCKNTDFDSDTQEKLHALKTSSTSFPLKVISALLSVLTYVLTSVGGGGLHIPPPLQTQQRCNIYARFHCAELP